MREMSLDGTDGGADEKSEKGKDKEDLTVRKFRGVPEDVQLFEVFWKQVVELIKVSLLDPAHTYHGS